MTSTPEPDWFDAEDRADSTAIDSPEFFADRTAAQYEKWLDRVAAGGRR